MSLTTLLFLFMRPLHVLLAAVWVGATVFAAYLLTPAVNDAGPAGGQVMLALNRRGMTPFFAMLAGTTVLSGIYLFWHFTGGFDPEVSRTHGGMAFGIGGLAGITAAIVGGSMVGRPSKQVAEIMQKVPAMPDGAEKTALIQKVNRITARMEAAVKVVLALQFVAVVLMALGHYI